MTDMKPIHRFMRYQRNMLLCVALLTAAGIAVAVLGVDRPAWGAGLALGSATGLVKFRLRVLALLRLAQEQESAKPQVRASLFGYALAVGALVAAWRFQNVFSLWATLAGLLLPNLVLIADGFLRPHLFAKTVAAANESGDHANEG